MSKSERNPKPEARKKSAGHLPRVSGFGIRTSSFFRISTFGFRHLPLCLLVCSLLSPSIVVAATTTNADSIPPLRPPRAELPPSFWAEHGTSVVLGGLAVLGLICIAVWWLSRKRSQVVAPSEVQSTEGLMVLLNQLHNDALRSRLS